MSRSNIQVPTLEKRYIFREASHIDCVHKKRHMDVFLETLQPVPPLPYKRHT
jgi:hypothetical protein